MKKVLPIIYIIAFVIGIIIIITSDTGLIGSYIPALIVAGTIISCFAGVFLAIYLYAWHNQSKWVMSISVYQKQRLPCRKLYGRAGTFFLYCVLSGGKGQLAPVGQGDICRQVCGDLNRISHRIAVISRFWNQCIIFANLRQQPVACVFRCESL